MLAVVFIAGHWAFLSDQYSALAQQTFYTLFSGANILFFAQAKGYFFSELEFPLLHCWSLAVEEQYYLVYPLLLAVAWKLKPHRATIFGVLVFIGVASFIASTVVTPHDPSFAFYLLPCRAWEMALGGLLSFDRGPSYLTSRMHVELVGCLGLVLIATSYFLYDENVPYPGQYPRLALIV